MLEKNEAEMAKIIEEKDQMLVKLKKKLYELE